MQDNPGQTDPLSPEIQEVMRSFVAAARAVKLYPQNNPIYMQSVKKSFESLDNFLKHTIRFSVGIQKAYFLYENTPVAKETQLNRTIAQDLFGKGFREILFLEGLTEEELLGFYAALSLSQEEQALRSGIVSILWEQGSTHIKITEAALEDVITTHPDMSKLGEGEERSTVQISPDVARKEIRIAGRTLVLGDLMDDPVRFAASMVGIARETLGENESIEDRLHALYQEAGKEIQGMPQEQQGALFQGLAKSVLAMDPEHRDKFIAAKLYAGMDGDQVREQSEQTDAVEGPTGGPLSHSHIPEELHEIVTGRFSKQWTVHQIAELLKRAAAKKIEAPAPAVDPTMIEAVPVSADLYTIAKELAEYSPEEMETLKAISGVGMEPDIIEASVRTLIFLITLVKRPGRPEALEKTVSRFSSVVRQLEDSLTYLLKGKDYDLATIIVRALHLPVDPLFKPRLNEAIKKASSQDILSAVVTHMRSNQKASPDYLSAYAYLQVLDQEAMPGLLDILSVEKDRAIRKYLVEILKDLGRKQISLIARHLTDGRWYVVRNIVNILGDSKSEEAISYLERVADHKQVQIRQEVIKGLISIGGKKAAVLLTRFLRDRDPDVQIAAVRAIAIVHGAGRSEAQTLADFLLDRPVRKKENELTVEVIKALEKIGDQEIAEFLKRYTRIKWWRSRKPQEELRTVAVVAIDTIGRRLGDVGRKH
ncbi:MAG: HEAT repeat domain-containing protein [Nitrospirota bacterium]